jgi:hypothetical protein
VSRGFATPDPGYGDRMSSAPQDEQPDEATGPPNPRGPGGPDAPAPPGGPLRSDEPAGPLTPGGPRIDPGTEPGTAPEPEVHPSSTPEGPQTIPTPGPPTPDPGSAPDGEIHARTQAEQVNEEMQRENAESSLDQPSDGSGLE